jgi:uncharacterized protein YcbX
MHLSQIHTYPIKSTHPISPQSAYLFPTGIALDRHWMVIDGNNAMVTSRKHPKLLHVLSRVEGDNLRVTLKRQEFLLPLAAKPNTPIMVKHWAQAPLLAWPQSEALDAALSDYLGMNCRIVFSASLYSKSTSEAVSFADAQPVLLTTTASLAALNQRLDVPIGMDRFRSNLVVDNIIADVEDGWKRIRIGECELEVTYPCERCVLTTIDPELLTKHQQQEPLRTLATYRKLPEGGVGFGVNLIVVRPGAISIGDTVEVLS